MCGSYSGSVVKSSPTQLGDDYTIDTQDVNKVLSVRLTITFTVPRIFNKIIIIRSFACLSYLKPASVPNFSNKLET